jgi:hypothetical protein
MILKSEAQQIKHVISPARDRKYTLVAYSRLLADYCSQMPQECTSELVSALIDAAKPASSGFALASTIEKSVEDQLLDGAID